MTAVRWVVEHMIELAAGLLITVVGRAIDAVDGL